MTRPVKELAGFERISLLPGEAKTVRFEIPVSSLGFCGLELAYVVEAGDFDVWIAPDSVRGPRGQFTVQGEYEERTVDGILEWGANVVLWFQQFSPALDLPFSILTFMGNEEFFLLLLPFVYWCLDRRTGARLVVLFMFSTWVNAVAKALGQQPRPFQYDPRIRMIREAEGWGFPSGHTQGAVVVWGYLGAQVRRRWFWIIAVLLMVLIPMSRVYLGVHFPQDLLGGYVIGGGLVLLYLWLQPKIESWFADQTWVLVMGIALLVPIIMALVFPDEDGVTAVATLWGMGIGFVFERRWVGFEPSRSWWLRGLSLLIGLVVLAGLWYGLSLAFESLSPPLVLRFIRYGLVGLWGGLGAPWAFVRLGLAASKSRG